MKIRAVLSSIALASALTLSGGAFAQAANSIGGVDIPADQWGSFQEKCAAINAAANQTLATPNEESDAVATGSVTQDSSDADPASTDSVAQLLASLTPEQCKEAGL